MELTKQQRSEKKAAPANGVLVALALFIVVAASLGLTGCAGTLDKAMATCFALEKNPAYTKSEGFEKFECNGNGTSAVKVAR